MTPIAAPTSNIIELLIARITKAKVRSAFLAVSELISKLLITAQVAAVFHRDQRFRGKPECPGRFGPSEVRFGERAWHVET